MSPELVFPEAEFAGRLAAVRAAMDRRSVDTLLVHVPENIYYLSGYRTPGYYTYQCLALPLTGPPVLVVRHLEATNAEGLSYVRDYVGYSDVEDPVRVCVDELRRRGMSVGRVGLEMDAWFLTAGRYRQLQAALGDLVDCTGVVEHLRLRKSPAELDLIRRAAVAANGGMARALEVLEPGISENDVAAEVLATCTRLGSEYTSLPPFVTSGERSWLAHSTWEGRELREGDAVYLEISGAVKRYSAAIMRTAIVGEAPPRYRAIADTIIEGLEAAIAHMRPGHTAGDVDRACRSVFERDGIAEHFRHRTGYSIGIGFPPDWGEGHIASLRAGDPLELQPGMVFHAPPGVLLPDEAGIGFSDTVIVTEGAPERLGTVPLRLFSTAHA